MTVPRIPVARDDDAAVDCAGPPPRHAHDVRDHAVCRVGTHHVRPGVDQVLTQLLCDRGTPVPGDVALRGELIGRDHHATLAKPAAYGLDGGNPPRQGGRL